MSARWGPSKIASLRLQASGVSTSPLPATGMMAALIGSETPLRCASVTGTRSGDGGVGGSTDTSFTVPARRVMRTSSERRSETVLDTYVVGRRLAPWIAPRAPLEPEPSEITRTRPVVRPLATDVY